MSVDLIDTIQRDIHSAGICIEKYSVEDVESAEGIDDSNTKILELLSKIEIDISQLQYEIIPISTNDNRNSLEYNLFHSKELLKDLYVRYRMKKVDEKRKYNETLYLKSFTRGELSIKNSNTDDDGHDDDNEMLNKYDNNDQLNNEGLNDEKLEELSNQERLLRQNTKLTDKLQNVNALIKSTLLAGEINISELDISTNSISNLGESYAFFGDVLNKTNGLVKSINKASKSERAIIYRSLYFFISVCCWILWRRIFKRPVLLVLWLILSPLKMLFRSSSSGDVEINSTNVVSSLISQTVSTTLETATDIITEVLLDKDEL